METHPFQTRLAALLVAALRGGGKLSDASAGAAGTACALLPLPGAARIIGTTAS